MCIDPGLKIANIIDRKLALLNVEKLEGHGMYAFSIRQYTKYDIVTPNAVDGSPVTVLSV